MIIAVDADGTLWRDYYPAIGKPKRIVLWCLRRIQRRGYRLILNTCRTQGIAEIVATMWAMEGIWFQAVNENLLDRIAAFGGDSRKISCDYGLDDRYCCSVTLRALWLWLRLCVFSKHPNPKGD